MEFGNYISVYLNTELKMDVCQDYTPVNNLLCTSNIILFFSVGKTNRLVVKRDIMNIIRKNHTKISTTNCVVKNKLHCYSRWCIELTIWLWQLNHWKDLHLQKLVIDFECETREPFTHKIWRKVSSNEMVKVMYSRVTAISNLLSSWGVWI